MNKEQLDAIRNRAEAVMSGEWVVDTSYRWLDIINPAIPDIRIAMVASTGGSCGVANADFIAHAKQDIPALLNEVEKLQIQLEASQRNLKIAFRVIAEHIAEHIKEREDDNE